MTTVQITLPDQLTQEAQRAGLLSSAKLERWLRDQLKTQHVDDLFTATSSFVLHVVSLCGWIGTSR